MPEKTKPSTNTPSPIASAERQVLLGRISGVHGIKGDVLITSFTDNPTDIAHYSPIIAHRKADGARREITIKSCREGSKGLVSRIKGITDRNAAEALKGCELWVPRARLPDTDDEEFYHDDLIGMQAVDAVGTPIGIVTQVANYGAGDLLELELNGRKGVEFVPFTHAHVPEVRLSQNTVVINWPLVFEMAPGPDADPEADPND